jgi:hypothetical protein
MFNPVVTQTRADQHDADLRREAGDWRRAHRARRSHEICTRSSERLATRVTAWRVWLSSFVHPTVGCQA